MDLTDEENRRALETWASDLRASMEPLTRAGAMSLPYNADEVVDRIKLQSSLNAAGIERAIYSFSRSSRWPPLNAEAAFCLQLRVMLACRVVEGLLRGNITDPEITRLVLDGNKMNFTEWILTQGWDLLGDGFLLSYAETLTDDLKNE